MRDLADFEGIDDGEVAEQLADYFNAVSQEFSPLGEGDVPKAAGSSLPELRTFEVATRIRKFRKPKSMVPEDIFSQLMTRFSDFFAIPLTLGCGLLAGRRSS